MKASALSTTNVLGDDLKQKIVATNDKILPSLKSIQNGDKDPQVQDIEDTGNALVSGVKSSLESFARDTKRNDAIHALAYNDSMSSLLSLNDASSAASTSSSASSASSTQ